MSKLAAAKQFLESSGWKYVITYFKKEILFDNIYNNSVQTLII